MNKPAFLAATILSVLLPPAHASVESRRATITRGGGNGNCTITVDVDGAAEIEVSGDTGVLTTLAGRPARWRRFQCNEPLPSNPRDFRFAKVAGRRGVQLLQDPRSTGGRAVVQINDRKAGQATYTVSFQWRGFRGGWSPEPPAPPPNPWPRPGGFPIATAVQACRDSVTDRLNQEGYTTASFDRASPNNNPGSDDWIVGTVSGTRGYRTTWFRFACSVDFRTGRIRSVDVSPR